MTAALELSFKKGDGDGWVLLELAIEQTLDRVSSSGGSLGGVRTLVFEYRTAKAARTAAARLSRRHGRKLVSFYVREPKRQEPAP